MEIKELETQIREINKNNGWNILYHYEWKDNYKIPALLALIHSEVSEALEAFRENDKVGFFEELADVIIRILDVTAAFDMSDITVAIEEKLEKNKGRGYKHGGKRV